MYLNVNLALPRSGVVEGGCTPKTPEILNTIMSLSPQSPSASRVATSKCDVTNKRCDVTTEKRSCNSSDISDKHHKIQKRTSPSHLLSPPRVDDTPAFGHPSPSYSECSALPRLGGPVVGSPPSPVSTLEATKSALIKEGLKHQIRCKLRAAGLDAGQLLDEARERIKAETLTPLDEERRLRRRERNKVAATKCRNKKKQMAVGLISESESVEDVNQRLKGELERLSSQKLRLEQLLKDPCHISACQRSSTCQRRAKLQKKCASDKAIRDKAVQDKACLESYINSASPITPEMAAATVSCCASDYNINLYDQKTFPAQRPQFGLNDAYDLNLESGEFCATAASLNILHDVLPTAVAITPTATSSAFASTLHDDDAIYPSRGQPLPTSRFRESTHPTSEAIDLQDLCLEYCNNNLQSVSKADCASPFFDYPPTDSDHPCRRAKAKSCQEGSRYAPYDKANRLLYPHTYCDNTMTSYGTPLSSPSDAPHVLLPAGQDAYLLSTCTAAYMTDNPQMSYYPACSYTNI